MRSILFGFFLFAAATGVALMLFSLACLVIDEVSRRQARRDSERQPEPRHFRGIQQKLEAGELGPGTDRRRRVTKSGQFMFSYLDMAHATTADTVDEAWKKAADEGQPILERERAL